MPFVDENQPVPAFVPRTAQPDIIQAPPSIGETIGNAFSLENDVVNAFELQYKSRKRYVPQKNYDLGAALKERGLWDERELYIDVESDDQLNDRMVEIGAQRRQRERLAAAGWAGTTAMIAAGMASPSAFMPLVGPGLRGAKAFGYAAGMGFLGSATQESVLFRNQEERTPEEGAFSIAASTILSGVLGTLAARLHPKELATWARNIEVPEERPSISQPLVTKNGESVGAARERVDVGGLKPGAGNALSFLTPVTRLIENESPQARWMGSQYSNAGLRQEGNRLGIAAAPGGDVESLQKLYQGRLAQITVDLDEQFANYRLTPPGPMRNLRTMLGSLSRDGKLSKQEFREEIGKYVHLDAEHPIPEVAKIVKQVRETYDEIFEEAKRVGLFKADQPVDLAGAQKYGNIVYLNEAISKRRNQFVELLAANARNKLTEQFNEKLMKLREKQARTKEVVEDLQRPLDEAEELRKNFVQQLKDQADELQKQMPHIQDAMDDLDMLRAQLRNVPSGATGAPEIRAGIREQIAAVRKAAGPALEKLGLSRSTLKRRIHSLDRSRAVMEAKQAKKLDKVDRNEELQLNTLARAVMSLRKLANMIDKTDAATLEKEISKVKDQFAAAAKVYDKGEENLVKLANDEPNDALIMSAQELQQGRVVKMTDIANRLDDLEGFDREAFKAELEDMIKIGLEKAQDINARRAVRRARLVDQAKKLDPSLIDERIKGLIAKSKQDEKDFIDQITQAGADDVDLNAGTAAFDNYARDLAEETTARILGVEARLPYSELFQQKRGPELARTLHIDPEFVHNGVSIADFREKDIERMLSVYFRTMSGDISIAERFGDPLMLTEMEKLIQEESRAIAEIPKRLDKNGNPLSKEKQEKLSNKITKQYAQIRKDLFTLMERTKGIRGVPRDPTGWATRGARMVMQLNALRLMGGVLLASVSDPANLVMKHGLTRTFRDGFMPFITDLKGMQLTIKQAKQAAIGVDTVLHSRYHALSDMFDESRAGTRLEKGMDYASSRLGVVALFDQWTNVFKQISAGISNARIMDEIKLVMTANNTTSKEFIEAQEHLASLGIDGQFAADIYDQVVNRGAGREVNGQLLPDTDNWDFSVSNAKQSLRALRAALVKEADDTIVTPGLERPSWMDANVPARMIAQFRSFGMSSTTKTLMAGLQQKDANFVTSTMVSLALGALSYYLWAIAVGGDAKNEMLNAGLGKWADEAITRSGRTAVFDEIQRALQRLPLTRRIASFSGTRSTRREGGDLVEALLGPSFDLLEKSGGVLTGIDDPTKGTAHLIRQMLPFQNLFYLRQAFDAIEAVAASKLPERRQ